MIANCDKNLNVLKYTDFPTQNGLIYTDFSINILRTQNTALGTVMRGGAAIIKSKDRFQICSLFKTVLLIFDRS